MRSIHWEVHEGEGPFVLLVHGFLSSRAQWSLNLEALGEFSRPVVVELWGHGRSPRGEGPHDYRPEGYLAQFERIREALGAERWLVIGQSLGASLTLRYALEHPRRVIAQAFTNSNSAFADESQTRLRRAAARAAIEDLERRGTAALEALRIHPRHARRLPPSVHAELVADAEAMDPVAVAESYHYLNPGSSVRDAVRGLRVPTMLACGRYEKRFAVHRAYAEIAIPGLRVVDLDAGHAANIEAADEFNRAVGSFFREHLAREESAPTAPAQPAHQR